MHYLTIDLLNSVRYNILVGNFNLMLTASLWAVWLGVALRIGLKQIELANKQIDLSNEQDKIIDEQVHISKLHTIVTRQNSMINDTLLIVVNRLSDTLILFRTEDELRKPPEELAKERIESLKSLQSDLDIKLKSADKAILSNQKAIRDIQKQINELNWTPESSNN